VAEQFSGEENLNIQKWLVQQIRVAVNQSIADLKPALAGTGKFDAAMFTRNRLIGEHGTKNDEFNFVVIEQAGYRKAILGSFSAHATTLGDKNMEFSGDYPGYWERRIENTSADLALFFAGSMGSQSPRSEGEGFEKTKYIGEALADSLNKHLAGVKMDPEPILSSLTLRMEMPEYHFRLTARTNLATFLSKKLMPLPENVYLQAARIGNLIWITTPCDFSGEFAREIKNALAVENFDGMVTSYNGSYIGYIIPGRYFYMDEYESKLMGMFGPTMGDYSMDLIRQLYTILED